MTIDDTLTQVDGIVNGADLRVRTADLGRARPTRWAWHHRIALGYLNLLAGNEGSGKGTLIAWLISQLTRGALSGELLSVPVGVGVLGDEDSFDDVWGPRLYAAGADLELVVQIDRPDGGFVDVRSDHEKLSRVVKQHGLRVLFFDQLLDNLGVGVDDWKQKPVRDSLQPLRALARELDVATLGCLHPNKRVTTFRELMSGTVAFNSVSRCSLLLGQHPDDKDVRVLVRGKGNYSAAPPPIEFSITGHKFDANGYTFDVPVTENLKVTEDISVEDLLGQATATKEYSRIGEACEIIEALLPRDGAWHPAKPIYDACAHEDNNIGERTLKRAKVRLGIEHRRARAFQAPSEWRWPTTEDTTEDTHGPCDLTFPSVPSVPSANGRKPLGRSSEDREDTQDGENTRPDSVSSGYQPVCRCHDAGQPNGNGTCQRCYGEAIAAAMSELERHTDDPRMAALHRVLNAARNPTDFSEEEGNDLMDRSEDDETLAPVVSKADRVKLRKLDRLADELVAVSKAEMAANAAGELPAEARMKNSLAVKKAQESYLAEHSPGFARMRQLEHDRRAFVQRSTG